MNSPLSRCPADSRLGVAALLLLTAVGCGAPNMAPVSGTVKYDDGQPVTVGSVMLHPADDPNRPSSVGNIGPDGTFTVYTAKPGDGTLIGRYRVTVVPPGDDYGPRNPRPIDAKFAEPETSGIEFEVKASDNTLDITVTRPKK